LVKKIKRECEEVLHLLSELHPHDDEPALQEKLTQLIFACEMLGRLSVEAEDE
jgi:phage gp29-like protein